MLLYWIWFAMLSGLSGYQKARLLERFSTPEELYHGGWEQLPRGLDPQEQEALEKKDLTQARQILSVCQEKGIGILCYGDRAYPEKLKNIPHPPMVLYYRGKLPQWEERPLIGVVGTRKASSYGLQATRRISAQICACGGLVVTGGAAGIDTAAIHGALDGEGEPIVVLGCGVDVVYPASNRELFRLVAQTGCLMSEYPPGTPAYRWNFPERNRIISGLSDGTLVAEAPEHSGALITAANAIEQGRDVFVIPGNIDVASSAGSNALLRDGALAVFSGYDVVREYECRYPGKIQKREPPALAKGLEKPEEKVAQKPLPPEFSRSVENAGEKKGIDNPAKSPYSGVNKPTPQLSDPEKTIVALLSSQPVGIDQVIAASDLPSARVLSLLTMLQIKGVVQSHPGGLVSLKNC